MNDATGPYYYHYDPIGSVTGVTDADGDEVLSYTYDPFGDELTAIDETGTSSAPDNNMRFTAEQLDATGLYHLRARQYDASTGRFDALDPVEPNLEDGFTSPFSYANNRPAIYADPSGRVLAPLVVPAAGPVIVGAAVAGVILVAGYAILESSLQDDFALRACVYAATHGGYQDGMHQNDCNRLFAYAAAVAQDAAGGGSSGGLMPDGTTEGENTQTEGGTANGGTTGGIGAGDAQMPIDPKDPSTWAGKTEGEIVDALEDPSSGWEEIGPSPTNGERRWEIKGRPGTSVIIEGPLPGAVPPNVHAGRYARVAGFGRDSKPVRVPLKGNPALPGWSAPPGWP